jgi:CRISPR/Cas system type I-B associated protein Csh2 (Cas7 group RAMP superfamily)
MLLKNVKFIPLMLIFTAACSWVDLRPGAEAVKVVSAADVTHCQAKGSVQAQTKASVGFYDRSAETLQEELITLARNQRSCWAPTGWCRTP